MTDLDHLCNEIGLRHAAEADYQKTLALLGSLKGGALSLDRVELIPNGWRLGPEPPPPVPFIPESKEQKS